MAYLGLRFGLGEVQGPALLPLGLCVFGINEVDNQASKYSLNMKK